MDLAKLKCIVKLLSFFVIRLFCRIFIFVNQRRLHFFIKKFKHYSCFKAKRRNYYMFDSNLKNNEFNFY